MSNPDDRRSAFATAIVGLGAALFAASLVQFGVRYAQGFDRPLWVVSPEWLARCGGPLVFDGALLALFALHHSLFARLPVRAFVAARVTPWLERSAYVWVASALFFVLVAAWQPIEGRVWSVSGPGAWGLRALQGTGVVLTLVSAGRLGLVRLSGLGAPADVEFTLRGPYGWVRHPIYSGWLLMVLASPSMNMSQGLFATLSVAYLCAAIPLEERTLVAQAGEAYRAYQRQVRWRLVPGLY